MNNLDIVYLFLSNFTAIQDDYWYRNIQIGYILKHLNVVPNDVTCFIPLCQMGLVQFCISPFMLTAPILYFQLMCIPEMGR